MEGALHLHHRCWDPREALREDDHTSPSPEVASLPLPLLLQPDPPSVVAAAAAVVAVEAVACAASGETASVADGVAAASSVRPASWRSSHRLPSSAASRTLLLLLLRRPLPPAETRGCWSSHSALPPSLLRHHRAAWRWTACRTVPWSLARLRWQTSRVGWPWSLQY